MSTYNYMYPCVTCGKSVTEQVTELGMFGITNEICTQLEWWINAHCICYTANGLSQCLAKPYGLLFVDVEVCKLTSLELCTAAIMH